MIVTVTGYQKPDSQLDSVILLQGEAEDGQGVRFGVERRYAVEVIGALINGEEPVVEVEPWMILGRF